MKLPRFQASQNTPGGSPGRTSLSTGVTDFNVGRTITAGLQDLFEKKLKYDQQLKELEFSSKQKQTEADLYNGYTEFSEYQKSEEDVEKINKKFEDYQIKTRNDLQKKYGNDYKRIGGLVELKLAEQKRNVIQQNRKKITLNYTRKSDEHDDLYVKDLPNITSLMDIKSRYETKKISLEQDKNTGFFTDEQILKRDEKIKNASNQQYIKHQYTFGNEGFPLNQAKLLRDPTFRLEDIDGNEIPISERKNILKNLDEKIKINNNIAAENYSRQKNQEIETIIKSFYSNNNPNLREDIQNNKILKGLDKEELIKKLYGDKKKGGFPQTEQGKQFNRLITVMLTTGAIDTQNEFDNLITQPFIDGKIDEIPFNKHAESYRKNRDRTEKYKTQVLKNAQNKIESVLGVTASENILAILTGNVSNEDKKKLLVEAISGDPGDEKTIRMILAYEAANNINQLVRIGEENNISISSMLQDKNSPNYIINKVISEYLVELERLEKQKTFNKIEYLQRTESPFLYDPKEFEENINLGTITQEKFNIEVPPIENLSVEEYMKKYPQYFGFGPSPTTDKINPAFETKERK